MHDTKVFTVWSAPIGFSTMGRSLIGELQMRPHFSHKSPYPWYDTYIAARFESEKDFLKSRISEAERELIARERHLFTAPECASERSAVIAALRALIGFACL